MRSRDREKRRSEFSEAWCQLVPDGLPPDKQIIYVGDLREIAARNNDPMGVVRIAALFPGIEIVESKKPKKAK